MIFERVDLELWNTFVYSGLGRSVAYQHVKMMVSLLYI